jgi:glucose-6-phosphate-specific signal transduction histidine kinase
MLSRARADLGPWFHRHPRLALACAAVLFAGTGAAHALAGDQIELTALLLVFPVALVALSTGLRGGLVASSASLLVLMAWGAFGSSGLALGEWWTRALPLVLLGVLIGHASDVQRRSEVVASRLAVAEVRQREAAEINDTIVQRLVAAKWRMELGDPDAGLEVIDEAIVASQALVLDLLDGLELTPSERRSIRLEVGGAGHRGRLPLGSSDR